MVAIQQAEIGNDTFSSDTSPDRTTKAHWHLEKTPKYSSKGVTRSVTPEVTIRRARAVLSLIGVTQVAEVTGLDRLGIPNFMTVRPRDLGPGISYYNGKGSTRADAYAGALMEAVERHAGEYCDYEVTVGTFEELGGADNAIDPREVIVPTVAEFRDEMALEWVTGFDLLRGRATAVPLNCVVCPYTPRQGEPLFYASTNGLASGNSLAEALCHALCEVIERDSMAISMAKSRIKPAIRDILAEIGVDYQAEDNPASESPLISRRRLPRRAALLIGKIKRAGLKVYLRSLASAAGIATIDCTISAPGQDGIPDVHGGCGTHPDARIALIRALTEAAQSRVACIQGGREDLPEIIKPKKPYDVEELFGRGDFIEFSDIPSYQHDYVDDDIRFILDRLPACGIDQVVAFDLTREDVGLPVVRVVVPRAEAWSVFHLHTGRGVFGNRVSELF